jgi:hypothetical protein
MIFLTALIFRGGNVNFDINTIKTESVEFIDEVGFPDENTNI